VIYTLKLDEVKSKYAGLAQENGFAPASVLNLLRLFIKAVHLKSVINMF
jgi:hypothetical protein